MDEAEALEGDGCESIRRPWRVPDHVQLHRRVGQRRSHSGLCLRGELLGNVAVLPHLISRSPIEPIAFERMRLLKAEFGYPLRFEDISSLGYLKPAEWDSILALLREVGRVDGVA